MASRKISKKQAATGAARGFTVAKGSDGRTVKGSNFNTGPGVINVRTPGSAKKHGNLWANGGLEN